MTIDSARLKQVCEDVLLDYIGPVSFIVAQDAVQASNFLPTVPAPAQLAAFSVTLRNHLPPDLPRDAIVQKVLAAYSAATR
jgi:hypothetical protein